ncbi:DUF2125 domain-containing protein [Roseibium sp.]|uniref:DUF2125 domain-containing protein n=1 Tax=Roseibium sp. TaxID=1936156 RepID=UPI003BAB885F
MNTVSEHETKPSKPTRRRYILLMCVIGLVIAGWSGAWFFGRSVLADQLDTQLQAMKINGLDISCSDLAIAGYPFRYEVYCRDLASNDRYGTKGSLGGLNAVALIYNPWHIIFEAKAPASIAEPLSGLLGEMSWDTARASVKFSSSALGAFDAVLSNPEAAFENPLSRGLFAADKAELHLRNTPETADAVDGFVSVDALQLKSLPEFGATIDMRAHVQVTGGAALLAGSNLALLVRQREGRLPVKLVLFETVLGDSRVNAAGDLAINGDGTVSGKLDLTIGNADGLLDLVQPMFPPQDNSFSLVRSVVQSLKGAETQVDGQPSITLPVAIDQGVIRIGFLTLGRIPPLFSAGT